MAQEQFAGPEHYTEFDPQKFIRDMKQQADEAAKMDSHLEETEPQTATETVEATEATEATEPAEE